MIFAETRSRKKKRGIVASRDDSRRVDLLSHCFNINAAGVLRARGLRHNNVTGPYEYVRDRVFTPLRGPNSRHRRAAATAGSVVGMPYGA